jgi:hypothetical protein
LFAAARKGGGVVFHMDATPPRPPAVPTLSYERMPEYVPVARFNESAEAAMAAGRLSGEDVDFEVIEHTRLHGMGARGATIVVATEEVSRAVDVLRQTPAARSLLVERAVPAHAQPAESVLLRWLRKLRWRPQSRRRNATTAATAIHAAAPGSGTRVIR